MRCRKVRSYLSAYSNDELDGRRLLAVREHLSTCSECRREEAVYRSIRKAGKVMPTAATLSDDFNTRLLNRIAQERFTETRTKAYMPRTAPRVAWWKVVPSVASVLILVLLAYNTFFYSHPWDINSGQSATAGSSNLDDAYLTAMPTNNPNMVANMEALLAKVDRSDLISQTLTNHEGFGGYEFRNPGWTNVNYNQRMLAPYDQYFYNAKPIIRLYKVTTSNNIKGVKKVY